MYVIYDNIPDSSVQYATYGVSRLGSLGNIEALRTLSRPNIIAYNGESKRGVTMIISFHKHHHYYHHHPLSSLSPVYQPSSFSSTSSKPTYQPTYQSTFLLTYLSRERQLYPVRCRHLHVDSHRV